jgi:hypothetical protein
MITVQILINGQVLIARSARNVGNPTKEPGWSRYEVDDGRLLDHRRSDGAARLAIAMLDGVTDPGVKRDGE